METIRYLYRNSKINIEETGCGYRMDAFSMGDYRLIRVGVSPELWKILLDVGNPPQKKRNTMGEMRDREKRKRRRERSASGRVDVGQPEYRAFLKEVLADRDNCQLVCETPIPLLERACFRNFLGEEWVNHMMRYACRSCFVILGRISFLWQLLEPCGKRLRSLEWILPWWQFGEEEKWIVEELNEEFGLVTTVVLLETEEEYVRKGPESRVPAVVLDFTERERIPFGGLYPGSVWLDMGASEDKRYRIESGRKEIFYFSLKKEWKEPQKTQEQLDTLYKNGYNT